MVAGFLGFMKINSDLYYLLYITQLETKFAFPVKVDTILYLPLIDTSLILVLLC